MGGGLQMSNKINRNYPDFENDIVSLENFFKLYPKQEFIKRKIKSEWK